MQQRWVGWYDNIENGAHERDEIVALPAKSVHKPFGQWLLPSPFWEV